MAFITAAYRIAAAPQYGAASRASARHKPTPTPNPGPAVTTGTIGFHLLLGVGGAQDQLVPAGDNYTDLIMSNLIAGV